MKGREHETTYGQERQGSERKVRLRGRSTQLRGFNSTTHFCVNRCSSVNGANDVKLWCVRIVQVVGPNSG